MSRYMGTSPAKATRSLAKKLTEESRTLFEQVYHAGWLAGQRAGLAEARRKGKASWAT